MYFILYYDAEDRPFWEVVDGEDAMQQYVDELITDCGCDPDEIHVFYEEDEIV